MFLPRKLAFPKASPNINHQHAKCMLYETETHNINHIQMASSTWRYLGLSVAGGYTILGAYAILFPRRAAAEFFALPNPASKSKQDDGGELSQAVSIVIPLLGARDLSMAAAMFAFASSGKWREMGTVILAGTILCTADSAVFWKRLGSRS